MNSGRNGFIRRVIKSNRGSVTLFVLLGMGLLFLIYAMAVDLTRLYAVKVEARHALNLALRAADTQIDMDALADPDNPRIIVKEAEATNAFYQTLKVNLMLGDALMPQTGSIADGQVNVLYFKVVNTPPYSYTYGDYSETVNRVGSTAIIEVPVKLSGLAVAMGLPRTVNMQVHSTVYVDLKT